MFKSSVCNNRFSSGMSYNLLSNGLLQLPRRLILFSSTLRKGVEEGKREEGGCTNLSVKYTEYTNHLVFVYMY